VLFGGFRACGLGSFSRCWTGTLASSDSSTTRQQLQLQFDPVRLRASWIGLLHHAPQLESCRVRLVFASSAVQVYMVV
jgi:hypothetical protein